VRSTKYPAEVQTDWTAPDGSEWQVGFTLKRISGRFECVGFEIWQHPFPENPERPLRAATLRKLDFAGCLARAQRDTLPRVTRLMNLGRRLAGPGAAFPELANTAAALEEKDGLKTGRHAKYTRDDLERVAVVYGEAYEAGSASPTRDTANALAIPYNQTAKLVQRCRSLGLLPKTRPGFARGPEEGE